MKIVMEALEAHWDAAETPLQLEALAVELERIAANARHIAEMKRSLMKRQQPPHPVGEFPPKNWRDGRKRANE